MEKSADNIPKIFFDEEAEIHIGEPSYEFIPLETGDNNLIGDIQYAEIIDNRIFVLDQIHSKTIQVYDIHGKYISHIGNVGQGPGEYRVPYHFRIDKSTRTIWVNGGTGKDLLVYDLDTYKYLFTKKTVSFAIWMPFADGNFAWWSSAGYKKDGKTFNVLITDSSMLQPRNHLNLSTYNHIKSDIKFTSELFYTLNKKTYYYEAHSDVVQEITSDGAIPAYKVRLGHHLFPSPEYLNALSDGRKLMTTDYIVCYMLFDTERFLLARYMVNQKHHTGIYNKKDKKCYRYKDFYEDDTIFKVASYAGVTDDGRFILSVPAELLKHRSIRQDKLRSIAKTLSEEDNPVLCLITFK
jgi:hypothetical protein